MNPVMSLIQLVIEANYDIHAGIKRISKIIELKN